MGLLLINLQSNQHIKLDGENPLIIGRGTVEGCFNKKVSRNHGRITCTVDGKIRLAALHTNPCFFTRNGVPPVQQLHKDEEETLNEGDWFGLLPNEYWFKITSSTGIKIKEESSSTCNEPIKTDASPKKILSPEEGLIQGDTKCLNSMNEPQESTNTLKSSISSFNLSLAGPSKSFGTPEFEKTKRLPLWMYEIDDPPKSSKSPNKRPFPMSVNGEIKNKVQKLTETPVKKEAYEKQEVKVIDLACPSTSKVQDTIDLTNETLESSAKSCSSSQEGKINKENKKDGYESNVEKEEDNAVKRPVCQYEGNCYRKNPQHKLEYCHPGDSDFVPYIDRPLCPYGSSCYRINEKHKVEFRHPPPGSHETMSPTSSRGEERPPCLYGSSCHNQTPQHRKDLYHPPEGYICHFSRIASSPILAKRRRKKIINHNSDKEDDDDDDEYDLEDPFINDASSDEYVPSNVDSEEEEDFSTSREDD